MEIGRRDLFKFLGGSAVGLVLTPVPWTLLNDSAKWSQNWSWIPRVPKGEIRTKFTTCSLCRAGCGVKVRCVGDQPVSLAGVAAHPASRGALCPIGLAGHHQPYHPRRILQPLHRAQPIPLEEAVAGVKAAISAAAGKGHVAIFDPAPGRAVSSMYRRFSEKIPGGLYLALPGAGATLRRLAAMFGMPAGSLGLDLENVRTILSFSTPILDGWGTPGRVLKQRPNFRLIQVEAEASRTASLADTWLPIKPGTDAIIAQAIANVLTNGREAAGCAPEKAAPQCGIPAGKIVETAHFLATRNPPIVIGDGDPQGAPLSDEALTAIANLNILLKSVGSPGAIVTRRPGLPPAQSPRELENGAIQVLITAGSPIPWGKIEKKLAPGATIVNLSPWLEARADYTIPAPAYLESLDDIPAPADARTDSLSLSVQLLPPPTGVIEPAAFLARLDPALGKPEDALNARLQAIHQTRRGTVTQYKDGAKTPLSEIKSAEDFRKSLLAGAIWTDEEFTQVPIPSPRPDRRSTAFPAGYSSYGWRGVKGLTVSPILSKLYQESDLRDGREA